MIFCYEIGNIIRIISYIWFIHNHADHIVTTSWCSEQEFEEEQKRNNTILLSGSVSGHQVHHFLCVVSINRVDTTVAIQSKVANDSRFRWDVGLIFQLPRESNIILFFSS